MNAVLETPGSFSRDAGETVCLTREIAERPSPRLKPVRETLVIDYVHDLPGRLRVRSLSLKRNAAALSTVKTQLGGCVGVSSVDANALTGSVTVHYDAALVDSETLLDLLRECGAAGARISHRHAMRRPRHKEGRSETVAKVAGAVAIFVLEKALERSLLALVGKIF